MGLQEEINGIHRMISFEANEEFQCAVFGSVYGSSLTGRDGVLFTTDQKIGISAIGGFFTNDDFFHFPYEHIISITHSYKTITLHSIHGDILVNNATDWTHDLTSITNFIQSKLNNSVYYHALNHYQEGWKNHDKGNYQHAFKHAKRALKIQPNGIYNHLLIAACLDGAGKLITANKHYEKALALGPHEDVENIHSWIAQNAIDLEDYDKALRHSLASININPSASAYISSARAKMLRDDSDQDSAQSDLRKATELEPNNSQAWFAFSIIAREQKNSQDLQLTINNLLNIQEFDYAKLLSVDLDLIKQDYKNAFETSLSIKDTFNDDLEFVANFIDAAIKSNNESIAIEFIPEFDTNFKDNSIYHLIIGYLLIASDKPILARERVSIAQKLRPSSEHSDDDLLFQAVEILIQCRTLHQSADLIMHLWTAIEPLIKNDNWAKHDDDLDIYASLCFYGGLCLLKADLPNDAITWFHKAEEIGQFIPASIADDLEKALEQTQRKLGRQEFELGDIDTDSAITEVPTYEVLTRVVSLLESSRRLPALERLGHTLLNQFDQPPLIAVMGEYSVGKSTFINALLHANLLPTGEGVTTGTIVQLLYGEQERLRIIYRDGRVVEKAGFSDITSAVVESQGGQTAEAIRHVEVFLNAEILRRISIVDTPGLNAPFPEHKKTTEEFLEKADALLFVFNVEAAGKANEDEFLSKVRGHSRKAVGVVNQIDLVPRDEVEEVLEGIHDDFPNTFLNVLGVSGKLGLDGAIEKDDKKLQRSRIPELEKWLESNILESARTIKADATRTKVAELIKLVKTERKDFDEQTKARTTAIANERKNMISWIHGDLTQTVNRAVSTLQQKLNDLISDLAADIARAGTPNRPADWSTIDAASHKTQTSARTSWRSFSDTILKHYDDRVQNLQQQLSKIEWDQTDTLIHNEMQALKIQIDSWRKDLLDYLENVDAYTAGYFNGGGANVTLRNAQLDGRYDNPRAIGSTLESALKFMSQRAVDSAHKWTNELQSNFDSQLNQMERSILSDASRIRRDHFAPIERLADLCAPVPTGIPRRESKKTTPA